MSHEPLMGELASHLLGFQFPRDFKKGSILCLKRGARGEAAKFVWFLEPAKEDKAPKVREEL